VFREQLTKNTLRLYTPHGNTSGKQETGKPFYLINLQVSHASVNSQISVVPGNGLCG